MIFSEELAPKKDRSSKERPSPTGRKTVLFASPCELNKNKTGTSGLTMYFQRVRAVQERGYGQWMILFLWVAVVKAT